MKGDRPPCSNFSLTMIDEDHAVMFGEVYNEESSFHAWVLHLPTMVSHLY